MIRHATPSGGIVNQDDYLAPHVLDGTPGMLLDAAGNEVNPLSLTVAGTSDGLASLFTTITTIPAPVTAFFTSGYSVAGVGGARYIYDATVDAGYVTANPRTAKLIGARGFRLDPTQHLTIEMFGAKADWNGSTGTDNYAAFMAAIAFVPFSDRNYSPRIHLFGSYYISQTINAHYNVHLDGRGTGGNTGGMNVRSPTRIVAPTDTVVWVNHSDKTGDNGTSTPSSNTASSASIYEGILFEQATQGTSDTAHGFWMRGTCTLRQCGVYRIAGHGIYIDATAGYGGAQEGNANAWVVDNCFAHTVRRDALHITGNDANAGLSTMFATAGNTIGGCGIYDGSGLGNCHLAPQITGYGNTGITYGGRHYVLLIPGDQVNYSATITPGTNNEIWYDVGAGTASSQFPAHTLGTFRNPTAPIMVAGSSNGTVIVGGYNEAGGAGYSHLGQVGVALAGGFQWTSYSKKFTATPEINSSISATGDGKTVSAANSYGYQIKLVPAVGNNDTMNIYSLNGAENAYGSLRSWGSYHIVMCQGAETVRFTTSAVSLSGVSLYRDGLQVVGARQTGTAANATDLATSIALVNDLKAKLVSHGLIS